MVSKTYIIDNVQLKIKSSLQQQMKLISIVIVKMSL